MSLGHNRLEHSMVLPSYMKEWLSLPPSIYFYVYGVLTTCMCITCVPCPQRLEDSIRSPGDGVTDGYEPGIQNPGSSKEQPVPVTAKSDLQPLPSLWRQGLSGELLSQGGTEHLPSAGLALDATL